MGSLKKTREKEAGDPSGWRTDLNEERRVLQDMKDIRRTEIKNAFERLKKLQETTGTCDMIPFMQSLQCYEQIRRNNIIHTKQTLGALESCVSYIDHIADDIEEPITASLDAEDMARSICNYYRDEGLEIAATPGCRAEDTKKIIRFVASMDTPTEEFVQVVASTFTLLELVTTVSLEPRAQGKKMEELEERLTDALCEQVKELRQKRKRVDVAKKEKQRAEERVTKLEEAMEEEEDKDTRRDLKEQKKEAQGDVRDRAEALRDAKQELQEVLKDSNGAYRLLNKVLETLQAVHHEIIHNENEFEVRTRMQGFKNKILGPVQEYVVEAKGLHDEFQKISTCVDLADISKVLSVDDNLEGLAIPMDDHLKREF